MYATRPSPPLCEGAGEAVSSPVLAWSPAQRGGTDRLEDVLDLALRLSGASRGGAVVLTQEGEVVEFLPAGGTPGPAPGLVALARLVAERSQALWCEDPARVVTELELPAALPFAGPVL